jgi:outer membrane protein assembly factor BamB
MRFRTPVLALLTGSALLALSGCTPAAPADPVAARLDTAVKAYTDLRSPTWTAAASIVGEPVAADGVVAAYTRSGKALQVRAWSAKTGKLLWHVPAAPGPVAGGIELTLHVVKKGKVAYASFLQDADSSFQRVVARRMSDGSAATLSRAKLYSESRPDQCADGTDICVDAYLARDLGAGLRHYRLALGGSTVGPDKDVTTPAGSFMLDTRVFARSTSETAAQVGYVQGGKVRWQESYRTAFAPGYLPSNGWAYLDAKSAPVVVGTGSTAGVRHGDTRTFDLAKQMAVGLRRTDGKVVWKKPGLAMCTFAQFDHTTMTKVVPLCGFTGTRTYAAKGGAKTTVKTAEVSGVEIATGRVLWKRPLAATRTTLDGPFLASSRSSRVLPLASGPRLVDLVTGSLRPAPASGVYACTTERKVLTAPVPHSTRTQPIVTGSDVFPCDLHQKASGATKLSVEAVRDAATDAGKGVQVVATKTGLAAYTL